MRQGSWFHRAALCGTVIALGGVVVGLGGCRTLPRGEPFRAVERDDSLSRLYLYRAAEPRQPEDVSVRVGLVDLGVLRPGEYLTVAVQPGEHIIRVSDEDMGSAVRSVDLLPGEAGWLEVGVREFSNALWVFRPDVPIARERIELARLAERREDPGTQPLPPAKSVEELVRESAGR